MILNVADDESLYIKSRVISKTDLHYYRGAPPQLMQSSFRIGEAETKIQ